jgi:hypothetical protein
MRNALGYALELAGICCIVYAALLISIPLAWVALGAALIFVAQAVR